MKPSAACYYRCPICNSKLEIQDAEYMQNEINRGILCCKQNHMYAIVDGVPIFLEDKKMDTISCQTSHIFRKEWTWFKDYSANNLPDLLAPVSEFNTNGLLILDAGCGAGRHLIKLGPMAKIAFGIDLSEATKVAYNRTYSFHNIHIAQANLYQLPFNKKSFDVIYSIGVLHHLDDPEYGFRKLTEYLRPGGLIVFWVYNRTIRKQVLDKVRLLSTKFPAGVNYWIAFIIASFEFFILCKGYYYLSRQKSLERFVEHFTPERVKEYSQYQFTESHADWFDRLSPPISRFYNVDDIQSWFKNICNQFIWWRVGKIKDSWIYGIGQTL